MTTETEATKHNKMAGVFDTSRTERRQPGRPEVVHKAVLPLLRAEERAALPPLDEPDFEPDSVVDLAERQELARVIGRQAREIYRTQTAAGPVSGAIKVGSGYALALVFGTIVWLIAIMLLQKI